jgi:hypothetical protein
MGSRLRRLAASIVSDGCRYGAPRTRYKDGEKDCVPASIRLLLSLAVSNQILVFLTPKLRS